MLMKITWNEARVIDSTTNPMELSMAEKLHIYQRSHQEDVIDEKEKETISTAWKFALRG